MHAHVLRAARQAGQQAASCGHGALIFFVQAPMCADDGGDELECRAAEPRRHPSRRSIGLAGRVDKAEPSVRVGRFNRAADARGVCGERGRAT
eukprot:scaffold18742_cov106-Isochrysis_galbana.AAC.2